MALDIYAGLFADDLDAVADRHDRAFLKLNADKCGPNGAQDGQTRPSCPSRTHPNRALVRPNDLRAASGNRTPDLRITSESSGGRWPMVGVV
jgi:hypothetical protein